MRHHIHATTKRVRSQRAANASKSNDAEGLAAQFGALAVGFLQRLEFTRATHRHLTVAVVLEARQAEEVSHDQFGHALGGGCRGVEDSEALISRVFHIDVVHAHTASSDELEGGAGVNQGLTHLGGRPDEDAVNGVLVDECLEVVGVDKLGVQSEAGVAERLFTGGADAVVGKNVHEEGNG